MYREGWTFTTHDKCQARAEQWDRQIKFGEWHLMTKDTRRQELRRDVMTNRELFEEGEGQGKSVPINVPIGHDWELRWIGGEQNDWVCQRCGDQADSQESYEFKTTCIVPIDQVKQESAQPQTTYRCTNCGMAYLFMGTAIACEVTGCRR